MERKTTEDFDEKYTLVRNPYEDTFQFESYCHELDFVLHAAKTKPRTVWTVVDGDDGQRYIIAGYHVVNRIFYYITEQEWESDNEEYVLL